MFLALMKVVTVDIDTHNLCIVIAAFLLWAVCLYLLNHRCECGNCTHCRNEREERKRRDRERYR